MTGRRATILVFVCLAAAAGNVYRTVWWPRPVVRGYRGFYVPASTIDGRVVRWARGYAKIEIMSPPWRPLRIGLQLHGSRQEVPLKIALAAEDKPLAQLDAQPGWHEVELVIASASPRGERFDLQVYSTLDQDNYGVGVGDVVVEPILTWGSIALHAALGASGPSAGEPDVERGGAARG